MSGPRASAIGPRLTRLLADHRSGSFSSNLRRRRWERLVARFPDLPDMRVIDIGGLADAWLAAPLRPRELVVLNVPAWNELAARSEDRLTDTTSVTHIAGDACDPSEELLRERFDLAYCNSVIEHVGGHQRRVRIANTINRLSEHHWVQTPYRYFPIEAHTLFPGLQLLPMIARAAAIRRWPLGYMMRFSREWPQTDAWVSSIAQSAYGAPLRELSIDHAVIGLQSIELLSRAEMHVYFPNSEILAERVAGVPKSLIAVR